MRITGIPFHIISNFNVNYAARSFLYDPDRRYGLAYDFDPTVRPTQQIVTIMHEVLASNPLVASLVNWATQDMPEARLELKWPGTDPAVRAFTINPTAAQGQPRSVFISRLDEDQPSYVNSYDEIYPLVNFPVLFPLGKNVMLQNGAPLFGINGPWEGSPGALKNSTVMVTLQPLQRENKSFPLVCISNVLTYTYTHTHVSCSRTHAECTLTYSTCT